MGFRKSFLLLLIICSRIAPQPPRMQQPQLTINQHLHLPINAFVNDQQSLSPPYLPCNNEWLLFLCFPRRLLFLGNLSCLPWLTSLLAKDVFGYSSSVATILLIDSLLATWANDNGLCVALACSPENYCPHFICILIRNLGPRRRPSIPRLSRRQR